jgi:hypothetical protein
MAVVNEPPPPVDRLEQDRAGEAAVRGGDALADRRDARPDRQDPAATAAPLGGIHDGLSFHGALEDRAVIGIAQGLLMAGMRVTADGAFGLLLEESLHNNRRMRDVASEMVAECNKRAVDPITP